MSALRVTIAGNGFGEWIRWTAFYFDRAPTDVRSACGALLFSSAAMLRRSTAGWTAVSLREIVDLVTARGTGSNNGGRWIFAANLREQPPFTDLSGDLEMFFRIAEGSSHAAAACIEVDDSRAGNLFQKSFGRGQQAHGFLMAVSV